jgi:hypothetical protein
MNSQGVVRPMGSAVVVLPRYAYAISRGVRDIPEFFGGLIARSSAHFLAEPIAEVDRQWPANLVGGLPPGRARPLLRRHLFQPLVDPTRVDDPMRLGLRLQIGDQQVLRNGGRAHVKPLKLLAQKLGDVHARFPLGEAASQLPPSPGDTDKRETIALDMPDEPRSAGFGGAAETIDDFRFSPAQQRPFGGGMRAPVGLRVTKDALEICEALMLVRFGQSCRVQLPQRQAQSAVGVVTTDPIDCVQHRAHGYMI